jgi:hypothetical protein
VVLSISFSDGDVVAVAEAGTFNDSGIVTGLVMAVPLSVRFEPSQPAGIGEASATMNEVTVIGNVNGLWAVRIKGDATPMLSTGPGLGLVIVKPEGVVSAAGAATKPG